MPHENNPNNPYSISEDNEVREDNECLVKVRSPESGQMLELTPVKVWVLRKIKLGLFKDPTTGKYFRSRLPDDYPEYCIQRVNKEYREGETIQGAKAEEELEARDLLKDLEETLNTVVEDLKEFMKSSKEVESRYPENPYARLVSRIALCEAIATALALCVGSLTTLIDYLATKLGIRDDAFWRVTAKLMEITDIATNIATEEVSKLVEGSTVTSSLSRLLHELKRRSMGNG